MGARVRLDAVEAKLPGTRLLALRVWTVVGGIVIAIAVLNVLGALAPVIEFLAVGSLIAFIESPIVNALERKGVPRAAGAFIGLVAVILILFCVIMVIAPIFVDQVLEVLSRLPSQLRSLGDWAVRVAQDFEAISKSSWANELDSMFQSLANIASSYVTQLAGDVGRGLFPILSGFASQLFIFFLGLVLAYWLALDYPKIHREVGTIVGEERETSYRFMVAILSRSVGGLYAQHGHHLVRERRARVHRASHRGAPLCRTYGRAHRAVASHTCTRPVDLCVRGNPARAFL